MSLQSNRAGRVVGLAAGLVALTIAVGVAQAHILLIDPKPRDQNDMHKMDAMPCPTRTVNQPVTMIDPMGVAYAGGATITVKWGETTNHPGCFAVDISPNGDTGWMMLGMMAHSNAAFVRDPVTRLNARPYMTTVKLPDGMACDKCTLRVRQFMMAAAPDATHP